MSWRMTLSLFVALVALAGVYFAMQQRSEEKVLEAEAAKRLFAWTPEEVSRVTLRPLEAKVVVGERVPDDGWRIVEPNPTIPPFNPMWERMAAQLSGLMNERSIEPGELKLSDYGLDIPVLEMDVVVDEENIQLAFGALEPTQERRYALLNGELLFLAHKNAFFELNRTLDDLRNKFTVDDREANILRLEFAQIWTGESETTMEEPPAIGEESPPIIAAREDADSPWRLVAPRQAAANQEIINAIVQELQFATGRRFVDDVASLADYGLQPARLRITMVDDAEGRAQTFYLGGAEADTGGLYVRRPDRDGVFVLDPHIVTLLPRSPDQFQERRLLTLQDLDVERLLVSHGGATTTLLNDAVTGWRVETTDPFDTDQAAVSTYISALKRAAGEKILLADPAEVGLAEAETVIEMQPRGGGSPAIIRLQSNWDDPAYMVAQQDLGAIMTLPRAQGELLQVDQLYFRSRKLWTVDTAAVNEVQLAFDGATYRFKRAHGIWAVVEPEALKLPDSGLLDTWLGRMAELRVISPRPEEGVPAEAFGFETPLLKLTLSGEEGEMGTVQIGSPSAEKMLQRYTQVAGQDEVYRVDQKIVDATRDMIGALQPK